VLKMASARAAIGSAAASAWTKVTRPRTLARIAVRAVPSMLAD